jgi:response regulator NasT
MRADLDKARADLAARKNIERAKGVLMKMRGIDEESAYAELRKLAMDSGRPLAAVASDLLVVVGLLDGSKR